MKKEKPTKGSHKPRLYTVTEVGTLLENMDKKIDHVLEGHVGLDQRMEKLEVAVHGNNRRLDTVELRIGEVNDKASRLEDAVSKLNKDLRETKEELKTEINRTGQELGVKIDQLDNRLATVEANR